MKEETLRQKQIFEIYYSLGDNRSLEKLREVLKERYQNDTEMIPSLITLKRWSKKFNWQLRVQQRDIEIAKDLEKKTNRDIADEKAEHRKLIKAILIELKRSLVQYQKKIKEEGKLPAEIKTIRDLKEVSQITDTLIKLDMSLVGENLEPINIIVPKELIPDGNKS